ncbi:hypothetical protein M218_27160 [Burkholderia pseudomallei MSHR338]|nr:hypothetical protein D512_29043 [Burkholderia pseudomallei MSHR1043]EQA85737.1 hypothetical protein M218_27160 [Burkholderia pseudomallei MSHR338]
MEPAVVENETFDADLRPRSRQFLEILEIVIAIYGFPSIEDHRPRLHALPWPAQYLRPNEAVELRAQAIQALLAV